jgi:hypothetical protein
MITHSGPTETMESKIPLAKGQTWRSPKTHWHISYLDAGTVLVEGPRGFVRISVDGGKTWSDLRTSMTFAGFHAWIRKTGATLDATR